MSNSYSKKACNLWQKLLSDKPNKVKKAFLRTVKKLTPQNGECLSHSTALFFHGLISDDFNMLIFKTNTRKKSRNIDGFRIIANNFKKPVYGNIERMIIGDMVVPVSSISDCLIDIVSESTLAPPIEAIAQLFTSYSGEPFELLVQAESHSASALKRCLFWFLWCGRIQAEDLKEFSISNTPVNLDRRYPNNQIWEGICKIYFPAFILNTPVLPMVPVISERLGTSMKLQEWYELRKFQPFCSYCFEESYLPILNDSRPRKHNKTTSFTLSETFLKAFTKTDQLIYSIFLFETSDKTKLEIPAICLRHISSKIRQDSSFAWLKLQIKEMLNHPESKMLEAAMYFGVDIGFSKEVLITLSQRGMELVNIEGFSTLKMLCKRFLSTNKRLPPNIYRLMALCHRKTYDFPAALRILKKGLRECKVLPSENTLIGDIQLLLGSIFMQMKQLQNADKALNKAAKCFLAIDRKKYGGVLLMRGNASFINGDLINGRIFYLKALKEFKAHSQLEPQAKVFYNLALVEFRRNNYRVSTRMFGKAAETYEQLNFQDSKFEAVQNQAMCLLNIGKTTNALSLLEEAFTDFSDLINQSLETKAIMLSFIIWAYQVAGFDEAARLKIEALNSLQDKHSGKHSVFIAKLLPAMGEMLATRFDSARQRLKAIIDKQEFKKMSIEDQAETLFRYGQTCTMQKHTKAEGAEVLKKAMDILGHVPDKDLYKRLMLFYGLKFPNRISVADLNRTFIALNRNGTFDPFWLWYAKEILNLKSATGAEFIANHKAKTSSNLIKKTLEKLPQLSETLQMIFSTAEIPREAMLIKEGQAKVQAWSEVKKWQGKPKDKICIDCIEGKIFANNRIIELRKNTYSFKIFCHMLRSSDFNSYKSLYMHVWGLQYDPEWDESTLKAAIYRLRKHLLPVEDLIRLVPWSRYGKRGLKLVITKKWEAIV